MSSLANLPSPPQSARIKNSKNTTVETSGFQLPPHKGLKDPKSRRRSRASHDITPKPKETLGDPLITYFQNRAEREDGASCVFLLWGSENSERSTTWATDVPIVSLEDEDEMFASLAKQYAKELGFWRTWLSFRKFSKLKPVTFRLICRSAEKFTAFVEPLDLARYHAIYSERRDEYCDDDGPLLINSNGIVSPHMEWENCIEYLRWIESASFLSCYFRNPVGARYQNILEGFDDHCFIYRYSAVRQIDLEHSGVGGQTRYLQLDGLYIETTWDPIKCLYVFLGLLICAVVLGKLCWGSWEITFGAGSFLVALPMLVLTVFSYYDV
ncbi:hypothetical protein yc1106_09937 [Curvularia clavata]|uniref:Uncharacterized protein n=1 Tax=Curvularia clavata TaxID=95742 RepID=A0A9Q8ZL32_CURCL|nr:hypothetical protein yc1106_09937 [Curvularia clavata]